MGTGIERKFLVAGTAWRQETALVMRQGYLSRDKDRPVRVRVVGDDAFLTVKGVSSGATRSEFEYWADVIFVMEQQHKRKLAIRFQRRFQRQLNGKRVICLGIPDDFEFMQPELVNLLKRKVEPHL